MFYLSFTRTAKYVSFGQDLGGSEAKFWCAEAEGVQLMAQVSLVIMEGKVMSCQQRALLLISVIDIRSNDCSYALLLSQLHSNFIKVLAVMQLVYNVDEDIHVMWYEIMQKLHKTTSSATEAGAMKLVDGFKLCTYFPQFNDKDYTNG
ncbi:unnamed protein product [Clavelina lepadiformis]|uniref:Uncharacterized protein n=1 Tax=Clavelina lepadiformis TaxID=159417 RepID=A0ABP0FI19_CLALP